MANILAQYGPVPNTISVPHVPIVGDVLMIRPRGFEMRYGYDVLAVHASHPFNGGIVLRGNPFVSAVPGEESFDTRYVIPQKEIPHGPA